MKFFLHNWRNGLLALIVTKRPYGPWYICRGESGAGRRGSSHLSRISRESVTRDTWHVWHSSGLRPGDNWLLTCNKIYADPCMRWNIHYRVTSFEMSREFYMSGALEGHGNVFKWLDCVRAQSIFWCCIIRFQYWRLIFCLGLRGIVRAGAHRSVFVWSEGELLQARLALSVISLIDWWPCSRLYFWHRVITSPGFSPYNLVSAQRML